MAVKRIAGTPGPTEFGWGEGLMPDPAQGYVPTAVDQLHAAYRVNKDPVNLDPTAETTYTDVVVPGQQLPK